MKKIKLIKLVEARVRVINVGNTLISITAREPYKKFIDSFGKKLVAIIKDGKFKSTAVHVGLSKDKKKVTIEYDNGRDSVDFKKLFPKFGSTTLIKSNGDENIIEFTPKLDEAKAFVGTKKNRKAEKPQNKPDFALKLKTRKQAEKYFTDQYGAKNVHLTWGPAEKGTPAGVAFYWIDQNTGEVLSAKEKKPPKDLPKFKEEPTTKKYPGNIKESTMSLHANRKLDIPTLFEALKVTNEDPLVVIWSSAASKDYPEQGITGHMNLSVSAKIDGFKNDKYYTSGDLAKDLKKAGKGKRIKVGKVFLEYSEHNKKYIKEEVNEVKLSTLNVTDMLSDLKYDEDTTDDVEMDLEALKKQKFTKGDVVDILVANDVKEKDAEKIVKKLKLKEDLTYVSEGRWKYKGKKISIFADTFKKKNKGLPLDTDVGNWIFIDWKDAVIYKVNDETYRDAYLAASDIQIKRQPDRTEIPLILSPKSKNKDLKKRLKLKKIKEEVTTAAIPDSTDTGPMKPSGTFAGNPYFNCSNDVFSKCVKGKAKGSHWNKWLGDEKFSTELKGWVKANPNKTFLLRNEKTKGMIYARRAK